MKFYTLYYWSGWKWIRDLGYEDPRIMMMAFVFKEEYFKQHGVDVHTCPIMVLVFNNAQESYSTDKEVKGVLEYYRDCSPDMLYTNKKMKRNHSKEPVR